MNREDDGGLGDLRALSRVAVAVSWPWAIAMLVGAVLSALHVERSANGELSGSFEITTMTAVFAALVWLPALLRIFGVAGGAVKTPAGEATTGGFVAVLSSLDPEHQARHLSIRDDGPLIPRSRRGSGQALCRERHPSGS